MGRFCSFNIRTPAGSPSCTRTSSSWCCRRADGGAQRAPTSSWPRRRHCRCAGAAQAQLAHAPTALAHAPQAPPPLDGYMVQSVAANCVGAGGRRHRHRRHCRRGLCRPPPPPPRPPPPPPPPCRRTAPA